MARTQVLPEATIVGAFSALSRHYGLGIKPWISTTSDNPDMAERSYGDARAAMLSRAFPCLAQ